MNAIPETLSNAIQYFQAGQLEAAERLFREILQLEPANVDALHLLGILLSQTGRNDEASVMIRSAIAVRPDVAVLHKNLGLVLQSQGKLVEAVTSFQQAIRLTPSDPSLFQNLAAALEAQGLSGDADSCYREAVRLAPNDHASLNRLGILLQNQNKLDDAAACYQNALRLKPDFYQAHNNLGRILEIQGKLQEAVACYHEALRLHPDYAGALSNLGNAWKALGRLEEAVSCHQRALQIQPNFVEAYSNLANALKEQGKYTEAIQYYEHALTRMPTSPRVRVNLGIARLQTGDFQTGWSEYEWRIQEKSLPEFPQPKWDGSPLAGRRILLYAEQGLGDTLQFIRYAPLVKARGGHVIVACQSPLLRLLKNCPGIDELVPQPTQSSPGLPGFDIYRHLLSVPGVLGTTLETIPHQVPYLHADETLVKNWRSKLASLYGRKIGIAWQGSRLNPSDRERSFPLAAFKPLQQLSGINLISLQKGDGSEQVPQLAGHFDVTDFTAQMDATTGPFLDTAAVMVNLDLVITSDTAVAHLAGALGVPVWVALSYSADWRWLLDRTDSPWYPSMRLFRQPQTGDWASVFEQIATELGEQLGQLAASTPGSP